MKGKKWLTIRNNGQNIGRMYHTPDTRNYTVFYCMIFPPYPLFYLAGMFLNWLFYCDPSQLPNNDYYVRHRSDLHRRAVAAAFSPLGPLSPFPLM